MRMAKRRKESGGWQSPGTRWFVVQVQWSLAPRPNREAVLDRLRAVVAGARSPARVVFSQDAFAADAEDNEDPTRPFTDLLVEAADANELWAGLRALLDDPEVGPGLRASAMICCEAPAAGPGGQAPAKQLLLHHFDPSATLDPFR